MSCVARLAPFLDTNTGVTAAIPLLLCALLQTPEATPAATAPAPAEVVTQQQTPPDDAQPKKPATPPHTGIRALLDGLMLDITHLPSKPNLYIAMIGGGSALAVHPLDQSFNVHLRSHYELVNTIFAPAKYYGDTPEQVALAMGTYAVGRIFDMPKASHLGMDLLR